MFLDVVRVLVLVDQHVPKVIGKKRAVPWVGKEPMHLALEVGKVDSIVGKEGFLISMVCSSHLLERTGPNSELGWVY